MPLEPVVCCVCCSDVIKFPFDGTQIKLGGLKCTKMIKNAFKNPLKIEAYCPGYCLLFILLLLLIISDFCCVAG